MARVIEGRSWFTEAGCPKCLAISEYLAEDVIAKERTLSDNHAFDEVFLTCPACNEEFQISESVLPPYVLKHAIAKSKEKT